MLAAGNGIFPLLVFLALWALGGLSSWANKQKQKQEAARRDALRNILPSTPAEKPRVYVPPPTAPAAPNRWVAPVQESLLTPPIRKAAAPMRPAQLQQKKNPKVVTPVARKSAPTGPGAANPAAAAEPPAPVIGQTRSPRPAAAAIPRLGLTAATLRQQVVVSEILQPPLALRE
jgi:hypothetical protein